MTHDCGWALRAKEAEARVAELAEAIRYALEKSEQAELGPKMGAAVRVLRAALRADSVCTSTPWGVVTDVTADRLMGDPRPSEAGTCDECEMGHGMHGPGCPRLRPNEAEPEVAEDRRGSDEIRRLGNMLRERLGVSEFDLEVNIIPRLMDAYAKGVEIGAEYANREPRPETPGTVTCRVVVNDGHRMLVDFGEFEVWMPTLSTLTGSNDRGE